MKPQKCLYIDMDDVVADWRGEAQSYLRRTWEQGKMLPEEEWGKLLNHKRFYRNLPLFPGAEELIAWAIQYSEKNDLHLAFLTGLPKPKSKIQYAAYDKMLWAQERFPNIPVFFGPYPSDKHHHCHPGDILIDDRQSNCEEWRAAGGIAHQYTTWEKCKAWIYHNLDNTIK